LKLEGIAAQIRVIDIWQPLSIIAAELSSPFTRHFQASIKKCQSPQVGAFLESKSRY
jgi:hypothetical protein